MPENHLVNVLAVESNVESSLALKSLLGEIEDIDFAGAAASEAEVLERLGKGGVDVVTIDLALPQIDALCLIKKIRESSPAVRILVVTASDAPEHIFSAMDAGADGYVLKGNLRESLEDAVRSVRLGAVWLDPGIAKQLLHVIEHSRPKKNTRILPTGLITIPLFPDEKSQLDELASSSCKDGVCMIDPSFLKKLRNLAQAQA